MSAITAKASRKMKKYAVLTREPRCFLGSFDFSWEQRKAKELFVSTADKGYPELPVLSATQDRGMIRRDENSINIFHDKKNEAGYKRVLPGQFVIHLRSFQGGFAHSAIEGITSPAYTVFGFSEPEKHDSEYWKYVFTSKSFIRRLETVTYGIRDGRSISYEEFLTLGFVYPSKAEQTAIARYLDKLSDLITLHQRKFEKLTNVKKSMLEKMFPQNGSSYPEIRFKGFTDPWEQRKLGELCNITTGKLDANAMVSDGQYDFYTSGIDVFKIDVAAFEGPAITIAGNGASVGYMHLADGKFNAYQRTYVLTDFLADRQFLNVAIGNELPNKIQEEVRGSGIPYIVLNMLTDLAIPFPSHEEQYAIGVYFQQLDNLITLHQRELEKLQNIKKSMLEKMFV